jgi:hypothetical protein
MNQFVLISPDELRAMMLSVVSEALGATKGPEVWFTVAMAANRLGKSDKTIRNWIKEGRFTRVSGGDGSPYLVSSLEVDALSLSANSSPDAS